MSHGSPPFSITSPTRTQIDEFIEQNIQINSNKEIRREYLNPWTLKFKDKSQEQKFCQLREDMFRYVCQPANGKQTKGRTLLINELLLIDFCPLPMFPTTPPLSMQIQYAVCVCHLDIYGAVPGHHHSAVHASHYLSLGGHHSSDFLLCFGNGRGVPR